MDLRLLLDRIREQYTAKLAAAAQELGQRHGVRTLSEIVLRDRDGRPVREGDLGLPIRIDLMALPQGADPEILSVDSDRLLAFEPVSFAWSNELKVNLGPFQWDSLTARILAPTRPTEWDPLTGWYERWFREDEDGDGHLLGVVHFLSDPQDVGGSVRLSADLGSAPVEAFEGLLDAIAALCAPTVFIGKEA
jgi:hypothetical protein